MLPSLIEKIPRYCGRTMFGSTWVRCRRDEQGDWMRVLEVGGSFQSAVWLDERWCEPVFPYHWLFDHLFEARPEGRATRSVLVLGGGGYAYPRHLIAHHPEVELDVVEVDPAIERIARRYFFLDRLEACYHAEKSGRLRLHTADAYRWLAQSERRFDVIINDCFAAHSPEARLQSDEGVRMLSEHLVSGGAYVSNVVSALEGPHAQPLSSIREALAQHFAKVHTFPCGEDAPKLPDNNVVMAIRA